MKRKKLPFATSTNVTLEQVAEASGVSPSTVSRVLSGSARVSAARAERVRQAVAELGFVPNPIARALADGRTFTIGLLAQYFESPFYALMLQGVEEVLTAAGYGLVVASGHWDAAEELGCVEMLRARRVDGLIVFTGALGDDKLRELATELPVVVTGRHLEVPGLCALTYDDFEGARLATQHLIDLGHRSIAFIAGDRSHPDSAERERGYRAALERAGIQPDSGLVADGDYLEEGGASAMAQLLDRGVAFSAVFASNDQMAAGAARILDARSIRVPDDVSLVGCDDLLSTAHASPPRTTVSLEVAEMGRQAARAMLDLLRDGRTAAESPLPRLVVRQSTQTWASC